MSFTTKVRCPECGDSVAELRRLPTGDVQLRGSFDFWGGLIAPTQTLKCRRGHGLEYTLRELSQAAQGNGKFIARPNDSFVKFDKPGDSVTFELRSVSQIVKSKKWVTINPTPSQSD